MTQKSASGGAPTAVFFGCSGLDLTAAEAAFFAQADPLGFILFKRNCRDAGQVRALTDALRASVGRPDAPVLIDEEGGRVQRLGPPAWPDFPAAKHYGAYAESNPAEAADLVRRAACAQAFQLSAMGFSADAAPVLDLAVPGASSVIGERAYSGDPAIVALLGQAVIDGLMAGGIMPVIKHMPGHGRARVDSHISLPVIDAGLETLSQTDFAPFFALRSCPWGMVGHLLLPELDADHPASCSAKVIGQAIRGDCGFDGLLLSDDLSMGALAGSLGERAAASLAAGCDIAVHCNGVMAEMEQVAAMAGPLSLVAQDRLERGRSILAAVPREGPALDVAAEMAEISSRLGRKIGQSIASV